MRASSPNVVDGSIRRHFAVSWWTRSLPGGPTAAVTIDLLATLGVSSVVAVGLAASLRHELSTGEVVVAGDAVADECVSKRYGGHLDADPHLTAALSASLGASVVTAATTDAPFRQFPHDVARLAHQAAVLEMEGAALFAASFQCSIRCGLVLVVSDLLAPSGWVMGQGSVASPRRVGEGRERTLWLVVSVGREGVRSR